MPADKKPKSKTPDQPEEDKIQEDGWYLSNTIGLSPSQARQKLGTIKFDSVDQQELDDKDRE